MFLLFYTSILAGETAADARVRDMGVGDRAPLGGSGNRPLIPGDGR